MSKTTNGHFTSQDVDLSSHINHRFLSSSQKNGLVKKLRGSTYQNEMVITQLRNQISKLTEEKRVVHDSTVKNDFQTIAESFHEDIYFKIILQTPFRYEH